jgi:predicted dehydrogenase
MHTVNRRHFIMSSMALPTVLSASAHAQASANDRVRVAVVGFNGQGRAHINAYLKIPNVEIVALCDVDAEVMERGCQTVEKGGQKRPATYTDFRKLLEDQSIDAVSLATPNFHHTLQTIWALDAGKDVYVEKPCSYNMFEAQQIIAAARKHDRIVQDGTGAGAWLHEAKRELQGGVIGDVYMGRGLCFKWRDTIGRKPEEPVPAGVAYDLWTGPAPSRPFTRNRFHYNWHWQWAYGNGDLGNQGAHQLHAARMAMGVRYPTRISSMGGHFMFDDDQETPNTQVATFEFEDGGRKKMLVFEVRHWITNNEAGIGQRSDERAGGAAGQPQTVGNIWYGSNGYMATAPGGWQTFLGQEQAPGPKSQAGAGVGGWANFIDVVRSRKREDQLAEIEEGAISTMLIHLANIAYRTGRTLTFDPVSYSCTGDAEATAMFTRTQYRAPFVVPTISSAGVPTVTSSR